MNRADAVPERRRHENRAVAIESEAIAEAEIEGGQGVRGVHHRLGKTGRARREHQVVEPGHSRRSGSSLSNRALPPSTPTPVHECDRYRGRAARRRASNVGKGARHWVIGRQDDPHLPELRHVGQRFRIGSGRDAGGNRSHSEQGEKGEVALNPVGNEDQTHIPGLEAALAKCLSKGAGGVPEGAVA